MSDNSIYREALDAHAGAKGKLTIESRIPVRNMHDLAVVYTPGVAEPCRRIHEVPEDVYTYTSKGNMVAVVTDGSAVLGLGDIGPAAGLPVMEGKAVLFKRFAGVDAFPICVGSKDVDVIVETTTMIASGFGGVNLEDIAAPRCFEIERKLKERLDIPVFHDDQHGTAVIVLAGLLNALEVVGKAIEGVKIVVNGAGAAGIAICKLLQSVGVGRIVLCDRSGAIYSGRETNMNWIKEEMARVTNKDRESGALTKVVAGADVFLGVSGPGLVTPDMVRSMASDPIIFAMANPTPEIYPDDARAAGAAVVATGRSDFPNQINNCLGFPGIFRGALDVRARDIDESMKLAAAYALAGLVSRTELSPERIISEALDERVVPAIAEAVAQAARKAGLARD
ncbi:MAG: NAD-dependent malic enzyme [Dethiosulfovibrio peptidovorans]|nr:MAG: NAD-dependent malic enzyme [Dethiosulfovibrio peptidovorans]